MRTPYRINVTPSTNNAAMNEFFETAGYPFTDLLFVRHLYHAERDFDSFVASLVRNIPALSKRGIVYQYSKMVDTTYVKRVDETAEIVEVSWSVTFSDNSSGFGISANRMTMQSARTSWIAIPPMELVFEFAIMEKIEPILFTARRHGMISAKKFNEYYTEMVNRNPAAGTGITVQSW